VKLGSIWWAGSLAALAFVSLSACDQKLASQPSRDHHSVDGGSASGTASTGGTSEGAAASGGGERGEAASAPRPPVRLIEGKPMWSDNRRHTAEENAQYQFEHHGAELGAHDLDDFLVKAHHFVDAPPQGVLTLTRGNGDKLLYDPKSGLFGVVRADGAPRTVTKPEAGQAFWDKQVEENKNGGDDTYRSNRRSSASRGQGGDDRS
jgi:hypothetical protein